LVCDGKAHRGDCRGGLTIIVCVGELVGAVVIGRREVAEAAICIQRQGAVRGLAHQDGVQGVAVHVAVIGQYARRGHVQGRVFGRGVAVVDRHRRIVDCCDGEGNGGGARVRQTVVGRVGESVGAGGVRRRPVAETAVGRR